MVDVKKDLDNGVFWLIVIFFGFVLWVIVSKRKRD